MRMNDTVGCHPATQQKHIPLSTPIPNRGSLLPDHIMWSVCQKLLPLLDDRENRGISLFGRNINAGHMAQKLACRFDSGSLGESACLQRGLVTLRLMIAQWRKRTMVSENIWESWHWDHHITDARVTHWLHLEPGCVSWSSVFLYFCEYNKCQCLLAETFSDWFVIYFSGRLFVKCV